MDTFLQRMIQRFHDQFLEKMSPERRARKLSVLKALTRNTVRSKNKENEDPLNNNMALPVTFKHSTPLKSQKVTDLDITDTEPESEVESEGVDMRVNENSEIYNETSYEQVTEPQLVITKIYDLENNSETSTIKDLSRNANDQRSSVEICVPETSEPSDNVELERDETHWKSLEVVDGTAEYEFYRSLEESKLGVKALAEFLLVTSGTLKSIAEDRFGWKSLIASLISLPQCAGQMKRRKGEKDFYVSTSSLLEEIEADLPSPYSLMRPLNHTFHTVTSYRTRTRLARMDANLTCPEIMEKKENKVSQIRSNALEYLKMEAMVQQSLARQAEKALSLSKTQKFMEVEYLECEKTLLLANLRYNAAVRELEKIKLLGEIADKEDFGQITISSLRFSTERLSEPFVGNFICTFTDKENVLSTVVVNEITDGDLSFEGPLKFQNLGKDFKIYIELFRLHSKEAKATMLTASILKKLKKMTTVTSNKGLTGPSHVNRGFTCVACAELRLHDLTNRDSEKCVVDFSEVPLHPVTGNTVTLYVKTDVNIKTKQMGFLNVFQQTWHRRWYSQHGHFLESWLYPEDQEQDKPPIDSIYLADCPSKARSVGIEVCIRPHSFVVDFGDNVGEMIFSADSQKDMLKWIDHLNLLIEHFNLWKPKV